MLILLGRHTTKQFFLEEKLLPERGGVPLNALKSASEWSPSNESATASLSKSSLVIESRLLELALGNTMGLQLHQPVCAAHRGHLQCG